jgi:hypothetical protein
MSRFFFIVYLSFYEYEEKYRTTLQRFNALHSYFNKFTNISYPIAYSLSFYEKFYDLPTIYVITPTHRRPEQVNFDNPVHSASEDSSHRESGSLLITLRKIIFMFLFIYRSLSSHAFATHFGWCQRYFGLLLKIHRAKQLK